MGHPVNCFQVVAKNLVLLMVLGPACQHLQQEHVRENYGMAQNALGIPGIIGYVDAMQQKFAVLNPTETQSPHET